MDGDDVPASRREFIRQGLTAAGVLAVAPAALGRCRQARGKPSAQFEPAHLRAAREGVLAEREKALWALYAKRECCPRRCDKNREQHEPRICGDREDPKGTVKVSSAAPHFGEEDPLVGRHGSGTVFFSNCSLLCCYCQNWEIAHLGEGEYIRFEALARAMLALQRIGCHNINLVTPTHVLPHIISGLRIAVGMGLRLPLVYNTGGYDRVEIIKLLDGIVDIYMPDFKYQDPEMAARYSLQARDYPEHAAAAIKEMHRQVGVLRVDERGIAQRGVILRHLVLPNNIAGTDRFVRWVAEELGRDTYVNLMAQYRPAYQSKWEPAINRRLTPAEWRQAVRWTLDAGLENLAS